MTWDPVAYNRFGEQRARPFYDLLDLLPPLRGGALLDLGCGDGALTRVAVERLGVERALGVDLSAEMLAGAAEDARVTWRRADLAEVVGEPARWEVVLSNAALQFVPEHVSLLPRVAGRVAPGGWLAVQMPYNHVSRTHLLMEAAAKEVGFVGEAVRWPQERPEVYATLLKQAGFEHVLVQLRTYRHALPGVAEVVAWMRSGGLQPWVERVGASRQADFLTVYGEMLDMALPPLADGTRLLDHTRLLIVGMAPR